jgi:L-methionine (R)-S-oxide reductase
MDYTISEGADDPFSLHIQNSGKEMICVHTFTEMEGTSKSEFYESVTSQARGLMHEERNELANLSNVAALLNLQLQNINWVGFYLWYEDEQQLILGPFQGKPACIRIELGKGVCGTAAQDRAPVVVEDVFAFPGHIACDPASRSEVVIPMVKDGKLLGVLDIDSPVTHRFDDEDAKGLTALVESLVEGTEFARR